MDLDFWDCFGRKKLPSYNRRNTVQPACSVKLFALKIDPLKIASSVKKRISTNVQSTESDSELFVGDTSKDSHSTGPVIREVKP